MLLTSYSVIHNNIIFFIFIFVCIFIVAPAMLRKCQKHIPIIGKLLVIFFFGDTHCHFGFWDKLELAVLYIMYFQRDVLVWYCNIVRVAVPEMLAMMVDLEDDPEWSVSDEVDDEDSERYHCYFSYICVEVCSAFNHSSFFIRLLWNILYVVNSQSSSFCHSHCSRTSTNGQPLLQVFLSWPCSDL